MDYELFPVKGWCVCGCCACVCVSSLWVPLPGSVCEVSGVSLDSPHSVGCHVMSPTLISQFTLQVYFYLIFVVNRLSH